MSRTQYYTFIGRDGSAGFKNGHTYPLELHMADFHGTTHLFAYWPNSKGIAPIPYRNSAIFLRNWQPRSTTPAGQQPKRRLLPWWLF